MAELLVLVNDCPQVTASLQILVVFDTFQHYLSSYHQVCLAVAKGGFDELNTPQQFS